MVSRTIVAFVLVSAVMVLCAGCPQEQAPATQKAVAKPAEHQYVYTVKAGETTLQAVAKKVYGDDKNWKMIADANPKADPSKLTVGQTLVVPPMIAKTGEMVPPAGCDRKKVY